MESYTLFMSRKTKALLGFFPSQMSGFRIYLTRRTDVERFFKEIEPANQKHQERFRMFWLGGGSPVGAGDGL